MVRFYCTKQCNSGVSVFRHDRLTRGGGVAVFCRNDLSVESVAIPQRFDDIEVVCIDIKVKGSIYRIIGYYRPPGFSTVDYEYIQNSIKMFPASVQLTIL